MSTMRAGKFWQIAIPAMVAIAALGSLSGYLSNSGYSNSWFAGLDKPGFMPPGWVFGVAWTTLYALMGLAAALIWAMPASPRRRSAITAFLLQLGLNYLWSPIFFGARMIEAGLVIIVVLFALVALTAWRFARLRPLAGLLLAPYLAWLCLATALNYEIGRLNPGSDAMPLGIFGG
ncbi:MAG TPA: TspO/MBR family protein [Sphingomicrobium sp.]|nr:TspO/MBR family protein [Sphingomicrobium sp.]